MTLTAKELLANPFSSDNGQFEFRFEFETSLLYITKLFDGTKKIYPITTYCDSGKEYVRINNIISKPATKMYEFLSSIYDVEYSLRSKEDSFLASVNELGESMTTINGNFTYKFNFTKKEFGNFTLTDNRKWETNGGNFSLLFSTESNKWHLSFESNYIIKTNLGEMSLMGADMDNLSNYINKISN